MEWIQIQQKEALSVQQRIRNTLMQISFVSYLLVPYMVVEFRQDCLDQMLSGFLQFPYQETHRLKTKQSCSKLASAEGKQDYIMKDMASMAKAICFLGRFACLLRHLLNRRISHLPKKSTLFFELKNIWTRSKNNFALDRGKLLPN
jgi:hypothetical protein